MRDAAVETLAKMSACKLANVISFSSGTDACNKLYTSATPVTIERAEAIWLGRDPFLQDVAALTLQAGALPVTMEMAEAIW